MSLRPVILAPLLVMVLLTFLIGGTAYQQTLRWKNEVVRVSDNVSQVVILSNIRWGLKKVQQELAENPEQAQADWNEIYRQTRLIAAIQNKKSDEQGKQALSPLLQSILNNKQPNLLLVKGLSQSDFFSFSLDELNDLSNLQNQAQHVTQWVTISMIVLGLVLTGITAYDLDRLIQQLARSRDLNIQLQEEERRRIAQDLHDGVVQELIDLKRNYAPQKIEAVIDNLRRVCHNLKPQVLEDLGLVASLEFLADDLRQFGIEKVSLNADLVGLSSLPKPYELPLFRVLQELCSNIKHHAQASQVNITIAYTPEESPMLSASIYDNGKGFDPLKAYPKSMGLTGVKERIQQIEGRLHIESKPGQGSRFHFTIPVRPHDLPKS
ncbi:sensor histidine kinase [Vampirovibrio sp.]|uniref:sensor histidine kinase n=1 Tax=Vampirovibrio sp. TaxID=2717857 RepID=UPI00359400AF